jgi:DNA-binding IclR family transcriptional regulator
MIERLTEIGWHAKLCFKDVSPSQAYTCNQLLSDIIAALDISRAAAATVELLSFKRFAVAKFNPSQKRLRLAAAVGEVSLMTQNGTDIYSTARHHHHQQVHHHLSSPTARLSGSLTAVNRPPDTCVVGGTSGGESILVFVETVPGVLRCIAVGGYPPPEVQLYVGRRDVTTDFALTHVARLIGTRGLRIMHHVTERWSHRFAVGANDDGSRITCIVSVSGLASTICSARLNVYRK